MEHINTSDAEPADATLNGPDRRAALAKLASFLAGSDAGMPNHLADIELTRLSLPPECCNVIVRRWRPVHVGHLGVVCQGDRADGGHVYRTIRMIRIDSVDAAIARVPHGWLRCVAQRDKFAIGLQHPAHGMVLAEHAAEAFAIHAAALRAQIMMIDAANAPSPVAA